jgi:hypothetical protein
MAGDGMTITEDGMPWLSYFADERDRSKGLKKDTPQWIREAYENFLKIDEPDENGMIRNA